MLSEVKIRSLKAADRAYKAFDEKELYLFVSPTGGRLWRFKYAIHGREKLLAFGPYPEITLRQARELRDEARRKVVSGIDPSAQKKAQKTAAAHSFKAVGEEWLALQQDNFSASTVEKARWLFDTYLFPSLGSRPIKEIGAPDILAVARLVEARGRRETAHRIRQRASQVFRYAIATGRAERDPAADLRGALAPVVQRNHAALIEPAQVGALLRAIDDYQGEPTTASALKLAPYVFVRPGELRGAQWIEIDLDAGEWRIPAERMKMGEAHLVPLARQSVKILREIQALTATARYVFPSLLTPTRSMSDNTLNTALRRMGYSKTEQTAHGFRTIASTLLNELGFHPDLIELQLAHAERNKVRAAYNKAQRVQERCKMMQTWADCLDELRVGGKVVPIWDAATR